MKGTWGISSLGEGNSSLCQSRAISILIKTINESISLNQCNCIIRALCKCLHWSELFLRWAMWLMGLLFFTAPTARHDSKMADKEQNGEKNLASEGPRTSKNLSKQTEKARQKSGLLFRLFKIISCFTWYHNIPIWVKYILWRDINNIHTINQSNNYIYTTQWWN